MNNFPVKQSFKLNKFKNAAKANYFTRSQPGLPIQFYARTVCLNPYSTRSMYCEFKYWTTAGARSERGEWMKYKFSDISDKQHIDLFIKV